MLQNWFMARHGGLAGTHSAAAVSPKIYQNLTKPNNQVDSALELHNFLFHCTADLSSAFTR